MGQKYSRTSILEEVASQLQLPTSYTLFGETETGTHVMCLDDHSRMHDPGGISEIEREVVIKCLKKVHSTDNIEYSPPGKFSVFRLKKSIPQENATPDFNNLDDYFNELDSFETRTGIDMEQIDANDPLAAIDCIAPEILDKEFIMSILQVLYSNVEIIENFKEDTILAPTPLHPGLPRLLSAHETDEGFYFLFEPVESNMQQILAKTPVQWCFDNGSILDTDLKKLFLAYQLLKILGFLHEQGLCHGSICPKSILLSDQTWVRLVSPKFPGIRTVSPERPLSGFYASNIQEACFGWCQRTLSTYDYLMVLNIVAGRRRGDMRYHPVFPWVIDFSEDPTVSGAGMPPESDSVAPPGWDDLGNDPTRSGWRNLSKSKLRLCRGDEMLDFTYGSDTEKAHHVTDLLSELSYCLYLSRRLPVKVLQAHVRNEFIPNEYPVSIQRLYNTSPDECIPEFYDSPDVFSSSHSEMNDLAVPDWADSPVSFVEKHLQALESDYVSTFLHRWIDLVFGCCLSGETAVAEKNVFLVDPRDSSGCIRKPKVFQIFDEPHPKRISQNKEEAGKFVVEIQNDYASKKNDTMPRSISAMEKKEFDLLSPSTFRPALDAAVKDTLDKIKNLTSLKPAKVSRALFKDETEMTHLKQSEKVDSPATASPTSAEAPNQTDTSLLNGTVDDDFADVRECPAVEFPANGKFSESLTEIEETLSFASSWQDSFGSYADPVVCDTALESSVKQAGEVFGLLCASDVYAVGCVIAELYLGYPLFSAAQAKLHSAGKHKAEFVLLNLPAPIRNAILAMISPNPKNRPSVDSLLSNRELFPSWFPRLYSFLSALVLCTSHGARLAVLKQYLIVEEILDVFPDQALDIILPHVVQCLYDPGTRLDSLDFVDALALRLGPVLCIKWLFPPIAKLYEETDDPALSVVLAKGDFIRTLVKRAGIGALLDSDIPDSLIHLLEPRRESDIATSSLIGRNASTTVVKLAAMVGPVVAVRRILGQLLPWLTRSVREASSGTATSAPRAPVSSDTVVSAVIGITHWYGEPLAVSVVLPFIFGQLQVFGTRSTSDGQRVMAQLLGITEDIASLLSATSLEQLFITESNVLFRLLLNPSPHVGLLHRLASTLMRVCRGVGAERTRSLVLPYMDQFFAVYEEYRAICGPYGSDGVKLPKSFDAAGKITEEFRVIYSPELVLYFYSELNKLVGRKVIQSEIANCDFIEAIVKGYLLENPDTRPTMLSFQGPKLNVSSRPSVSYEESDSLRDHGVYAGSVLGTLFRDAVSLNDVTNNAAFSGQRHEWRFRGDSLYSFRSVNIGIRAITSHASERVFVSGSRDGTAHVWRLDRTGPLHTYQGHEDTVHMVSFVDPVGSEVVSVSSSLHVWNAESGGRLTTVQSDSQFVAADLTSDPRMVVCGTAEGKLSLVDLRVSSPVSNWKLFNPNGGHIRSVSFCSGRSSVFIGWSTGFVSLSEWRTGLSDGMFRSHDGPVIQIDAFNIEESLMLTSSTDSAILWDFGSTIPSMKQTIRPRQGIVNVVSPNSHSNALFLAGGGRIGVTVLGQSSEDIQCPMVRLHSSPSVVGVQPKIPLPLSGGTRSCNVGAMAVLPRHHLLLAGCDDGVIRACV